MNRQPTCRNVHEVSRWIRTHRVGDCSSGILSTKLRTVQVPIKALERDCASNVIKPESRKRLASSADRTISSSTVVDGESRLTLRFKCSRVQ